MIVTRNWLKEFVDFDLTPEDLAHRLTMAGLEVESVETLGAGLDAVIVARLESVEPHPDADRLTLCEVETGDGTVPIVCGAKNHKAGDLVALAQVGTVLPGDFKIKKSKIRGQVSMGMLCSEKELGLAEEAEGIMILPAGLEIGKPVFDALGLKDTCYEIGLTPNRPDCLSVIGVAREVAAMTGAELQVPQVTVEEKGEAIGRQTSVTVEEPALCPRYAARLIKGVQIGASPMWLVRRLESVGMRSINNVVDVTNYVMMELGQPLHAFDFRLLREGRIVVRRAEEGSTFTTLDDEERCMSDSDLMICDGEGPVALAGIMGGQNSEINDDTVDILLESAYFQPVNVRRTSKRLGLHTESSHRFERGCDVNIVPVALDRAAELIRQLAGGQVAEGVVDVYPEQVTGPELEISTARTNAVLGLGLTSQQVADYLSSIDLDVSRRDDDTTAVTVPTFRPDLEREIDLVEEIARLHGYDNIPVTMPQGQVVSHRPYARQKQVRRMREAMVGAGFSETINYSFVSEALWDRLLLPADDPRRQTVAVLNPLTEEQAVMRTTLAGCLLETASRNLAYRSRDLRLFELRPVFEPVEGEELSRESLRLGALMCGRRRPEGWAQTDDPVDFYDLKGVAESLVAAFHIDDVRWQADPGEPFLHPGKSCALVRGDKRLGVLGEVHPRALENFDIDTPVYLFELDLEAFLETSRDFRGFEAPSRYPDVFRDSALLLDEGISARQLFEVIDSSRVKDVEDVVLFDLYRGKGVPEGKKSMAIRVRYRSSERTLTDEDIQKRHDKIVRSLGKQLGAEIR
ncbi:MAG: phenylalanine--tRNA ligase subunit beta [Desulfuromonadales bacterium]|nr:phenylalanine--tRNA ligase subunit beta [Desulfuromonadales bacterium]NIR33355.1 phenylalanine--tRNA ligase subunit beta [Desulfuromonadales bacterium]NIS43350.1 phenylalanine--tRNA ligase subunit beta [Desulfuromonadales bacterium]